MAWGQAELAVDPTVVAQRLHGRDVIGGRSECGLDQEAGGGVWIGVVIRPGRGQGRRRKSLSAVGQTEVAADLPIRIVDGVDVNV